MNRTITFLCVAWVSAMAGATAQAQQKTRCPEGRTLTGECAEPDLAIATRKSAVIYAIPKLSYSSPPYLPSQDREYYELRDHHSLSTLYWQPYLSPRVTGFAIPRP